MTAFNRRNIRKVKRQNKSLLGERMAQQDKTRGITDFLVNRSEELYDFVETHGVHALPRRDRRKLRKLVP